jgi:protoheme IX farnesyltransferase
MSRSTTSGQPFSGGVFSAVSAEVPTIRNDRAVSMADVAQLVRPRIALMVLVTVFAAIWLTAQPVGLGWLTIAGVLLGTALVAASSSIANQILERESDRLMARTASRPVAAGRLSVGRAWAVTALSLLAGVAVVWGTGGFAAMLAAVATWVLYVSVYTPLKKRTPLNTAVGAIAGGLPVAIGWFAADGPARLAAGDMVGGLAVAALGTVLYLWQFPHFMAIAWLYRRQYAAAGLQMLTVVDPSGLRAAGQSLAAALAMVPVSLMLAVPSASTRLFLTAAVASIAYASAAGWFAFRRDDRSARILLLTSLGVLLLLMSAAVAFGGLSMIGQHDRF